MNDEMVDHMDLEHGLTELRRTNPDWYAALVAPWGTRSRLAEKLGVHRNTITNWRREARSFLRQYLIIDDVQ